MGCTKQDMSKCFRRLAFMLILKNVLCTWDAGSRGPPAQDRANVEMEFMELWNPSIMCYGVTDEAQTSSSNDGRDCNSAAMASSGVSVLIA